MQVNGHSNDNFRSDILLEFRITRKVHLSLNPFPAKWFPIDEYNCLTLNKVKSISALRAHSAVERLSNTVTLKLENLMTHTYNLIEVKNPMEAAKTTSK